MTSLSTNVAFSYNLSTGVNVTLSEQETANEDLQPNLAFDLGCLSGLTSWILVRLVNRKACFERKDHGPVGANCTLIHLLLPDSLTCSLFTAKRFFV